LTQYGGGIESSDAATRHVALGGTLEAVQQADAEAKVLDFLKAGAMTEGEVQEAIEGRAAQVSRALRVLTRQGLLTRQGSGRRGDPYTYSPSTGAIHKPVLEAVAS
jgi:predicted transcriptional regulator